MNVSHVFMEENISERFVGTHETSKIGQLAIGAYRVLIAAVNFAQVTVQVFFTLVSSITFWTTDTLRHTGNIVTYEPKQNFKKEDETKIRDLFWFDLKFIPNFWEQHQCAKCVHQIKLKEKINSKYANIETR